MAIRTSFSAAWMKARGGAPTSTSALPREFRRAPRPTRSSRRAGSPNSVGQWQGPGTSTAMDSQTSWSERPPATTDSPMRGACTSISVRWGASYRTRRPPPPSSRTVLMRTLEHRSPGPPTSTEMATPTSWSGPRHSRATPPKKVARIYSSALQTVSRPARSPRLSSRTRAVLASVARSPGRGMSTATATRTS